MGRRSVSVVLLAGAVALWPAAPAAGQSSRAVAYQVDHAHSGYSPESFDGRMRARWSRNLGTGASYALIARGRVFALGADRDERSGVTLFALDVRTGDVLWTRDVDAGGFHWGGLAYDGGTVFVTAGGGTTVAYDEVTGRVRWAHPWGRESGTLPTAAGGAVFTMSGNWHDALDGLTGRLLWRKQAPPGRGSPAVAGGNVIYQGGCHQVRAYARGTGAAAWSHTTSCSGGGGGIPVVHGGRVYLRDAYDDVILDELDGSVVDESGGYGRIPAFSGDTVVWHDAETGSASARDMSTGETRWTLAVDLAVPPLIAGEDVFLAEHDGTLRRVDLRTGAMEWAGEAGGPISENAGDVGAPPGGLAAAEGVLVVPAGGVLTAYESERHVDPSTPAPDTEVTVSPRARSDSPIAVFQFNATQPGSSFECRLDDGGWERCRSPLTRRVADGAHVFRVRAVGRAGEADTTPEVIAWDVAVDRSPPGPATTQRVDAGRTGWVPNGWAGGAPIHRWSRTLDEPLRTPLIAGNRAFVVADDRDGWAELLALDLASGSIVWSVPVYPGAQIAYDDGQVFAVADGGVATAHDAATGARRWIVQLPRPDAAYYYGPPVAADGAVVAAGGSIGGQMVSVRQADGAVNWLELTYQSADPAVGGGRVYASPGHFGPRTVAWDFSTGTELWRQQAGNGNVVFAAGAVWTQGYSAGLSLGPTDGAIVDAYAGGVPAVAHGIAVNASDQYLIGRHASTGAVLWATRVGRTVDSPRIAGETVFVVDVENRLQAIDLATGSRISAEVLPGDDWSNGVNPGHGAVLATRGRTVSAFTPDDWSPPAALEPKEDDPADQDTADDAGTGGDPGFEAGAPFTADLPPRHGSPVAQRVLKRLRATVRRLGIDGLAGRRFVSMAYRRGPAGHVAAAILLPRRGVLFSGRASRGTSLILKSNARRVRILRRMPSARLILRAAFRAPGDRQLARARTSVTIRP